jgi:hypothetical protein
MRSCSRALGSRMHRVFGGKGRMQYDVDTCAAAARPKPQPERPPCCTHANVEELSSAHGRAKENAGVWRRVGGICIHCFHVDYYVQVPPDEREKMQAFGAAWAAWASKDKRLRDINSRTYLDAAEQFVAEFLDKAAGAPSRHGGRVGGAKQDFFGVVAMIGFDDETLSKVARGAGVAVVTGVSAAKEGGASAAMADEGTIVKLNALSSDVRASRSLLPTANFALLLLYMVVAQEVLAPAARQFDCELAAIQHCTCVQRDMQASWSNGRMQTGTAAYR